MGWVGHRLQATLLLRLFALLVLFLIGAIQNVVHAYARSESLVLSAAGS